MPDEPQEPSVPDDQGSSVPVDQKAPVPDGSPEPALPQEHTTIRNEASMRDLIWPAIASSFRQARPARRGSHR